MPFDSTVYRVLIASPSDVDEEREITTRLIQNWNDVNSFMKKIVLLPIKWETHTSPTFDIRPQEAINKQLVDHADLVIGLFWAKIGSETGEEISGTIEEIKRAANNGKDVMIYFSKRGIDPSEIDLEQLAALNEFKKEVYKNALVESFNSLIDFRDKLNRQLELKIRDLEKNKGLSQSNLKMSFINQKNGLLDKKKITLISDRIRISKEEIDTLILNNQSIETKAEEFRNDLKSYIEKVASIPILLGIQNNDNQPYRELNLDLQIQLSEPKTIFLSLIGSPDTNDLSNQISWSHLTDDYKSDLANLFSEGTEKIDQNTVSISTESITILPKKTKSIKPIIVITPIKDVTLTFKTKILSNNLLESINLDLIAKIKVVERKIDKEEIQNIINSLESFYPDNDDYPF